MMKNITVFALLTCALSSLSLARGAGECRIYQGNDLGGPSFAISGDVSGPLDQGNSAAQFDSSWRGQIKSLWIKDGYALEVYTQPLFVGDVLTISGANQGDAGFRRLNGGVYRNVSDLALPAAISSYRCRELGRLVAHPGVCPECIVHSYRSSFYQVGPSGSPHTTLQADCRGEGASRVLRLQEVYHNGEITKTTLYAIDLDSGTMTLRDANGRDEQLSMPNLTSTPAERAEYAGMISRMQGILGQIERGGVSSTMVQPPKPELVEFTALLNVIGEGLKL